MPQKKPDLEIISRYLQFWDPLGVIEDLAADGQPLSEYDSYALEIHRLLEKRAGIKGITAALKDIQLNRMALKNTNKDMDRLIAAGLVKCFEEFEERFY